MNNLMLTKNRNNKRNLVNNGGWSSLMDELFGEDIILPNKMEAHKGFSRPKVNIKESEEAYVLDMAVPGFKKSDFKIDIDKETLSIAAEITADESAKESNFTRKEFSYDSFKRTFVLPDTVEESAINATYNDGILSVSIPKKEEAKPKPARTIEIA